MTHPIRFDLEGKRTPWGKAQTAYEYAPGIVNFSCAGHGGFKLDRKANAKVHPAWRRAGGWYEEDCEWSIVGVTFPEAFAGPEGHAEGAHVTARNYFPDAYTTATGREVTLDESYKLRERRDAAIHADSWIAICASGDWHKAVPTGHVGVCATRGGKREHGAAERHALVTKETYRDDARSCALGFVVADTDPVWDPTATLHN